MKPSQMACWSCGHVWDFTGSLQRSDSCSACRRDAKVCLNCRNYERHANRECLESQADLVKDKEKSNFCEWFSPKPADLSGKQGADRENPLDSLFGGSVKPREKSKLELELEAFLKKP